MGAEVRGTRTKDQKITNKAKSKSIRSRVKTTNTHTRSPVSEIAITMPKSGDSAVTTQSENLNGKGYQDSPLDGQTNVLPRLLSYKDAEIYMSLSYWSIRTLVVNGEIPHVRFGKRILLDRLALDEWVEKHLEIGV